MSDTPWNMTRTADLHHDPAFRERVDMIRDLDRLRALNADLVAALRWALPIADRHSAFVPDNCANSKAARAALAAAERETP